GSGAPWCGVLASLRRPGLPFPRAPPPAPPRTRALPAVKLEHAGERGRRALGKRPLVGGGGAEPVHALLEPVEPRDGQPAVVGAEPRLAPLAPLLDLGRVPGVGRVADRRPQESDRRISHHSPKRVRPPEPKARAAAPLFSSEARLDA